MQMQMLWAALFALTALDAVRGAALHRRILEVHIVELNLYDLDLRVFVQNLIEPPARSWKDMPTWRTLPSAFRAKAAS